MRGRKNKTSVVLYIIVVLPVDELQYCEHARRVHSKNDDAGSDGNGITLKNKQYFLAMNVHT